MVRRNKNYVTVNYSEDFIHSFMLRKIDFRRENKHKN